jgi:hypothetical protein
MLLAPSQYVQIILGILGFINSINSSLLYSTSINIINKITNKYSIIYNLYKNL